MLRLTLLLLFGAVLCASPASADPIMFNIGSCTSGDCAAFNASGRGSILARVELVNQNDLLVTLTNDLNAAANGDDPYLASLGFDYSGLLSGLTFDSFSVISGQVARPTFSVDSSIRSFYIDFGFAFSQDGRYPGVDGRFQAMDPNEVVQMIIGTTGEADLSQFQLGIAKVGGAGDGGTANAIVLTGTPVRVPEASSLLFSVIGFGALALPRRFCRTA